MPISIDQTLHGSDTVDQDENVEPHVSERVSQRKHKCIPPSRLVSVESHLLSDFVASSEAQFIVERLEFLPSREIIKLIKVTLRHVDDVYSTNSKDADWLKEIKIIFNKIKDVLRISHMSNLNHNESCTEHIFKVPFQTCLAMVAQRELTLEKGNVVVPCGKWKVFLKCFLEAHIKKEMKKIEEIISEPMLDQRIQDLKSIVYRCYFKCGDPKIKINFNVRKLDNVKLLFPPCMMNLYKNLKLKHRLGHSARFNFSLFLKDIGMPLNESISFWKNEYSMQNACGSKCSHSWQNDSAKYIYSIRHLYGLEGKRANYTSPSCSSIQRTVIGPLEEGGCPFINFNIKDLEDLLDSKIVNNRECFEILMQLKSDGRFSEACNYYCTALRNLKTQCETSNNSSPVEYFMFLYKYHNLEEY